MDGLILTFFLISTLSSIAGSVCGIGGGVIIKPVLDAVGVMSVSEISFLSGCTVLAMSVVSIYKNICGRKMELQINIVVPLAVGAAAGGAVGKVLFQTLKQAVGNENLVGLMQAVILAVITLGTLLYTVYKRKIHTLHYSQIRVCLAIGFFLGIMSSFLGIGGGPINIVMLGFFFSMEMKEAAVSSLFIIMLSQFTGLVQTMLAGTIPHVKISYLVVMTAGGILGGALGSKARKRLKDGRVNQFFVILMAVIIGINVWNAVIFAGGL